MADTPTTSFRFPEETKAQIERLRAAYPDPRGRPATAVDVVCLAIFKMAASLGLDTPSDSGKKKKNKS